MLMLRIILRNATHVQNNTRRSLHFLQTSTAARSLIATSRPQQISTRLSSTVKKPVENDPDAPKKELSSVPPLPTPPPPPKGIPPTISTRDIEEYVQPLYARGWGLAPILPNGNGIAVLRKRFDFASAEALQAFLADLREYEEKKQHHAKTNVFEDQHQHAVLVSTWTHVARKPSDDAKGGDKDGVKTQGVTARDIRLAYALEELVERALATSGKEYSPRSRPEADRPKTVEELDGYT
ncbi:hypothetical protein BJV78DRAFT_1278634 [Lactifluus subvellereus]|nr:hypothetical protein BJV78DRAFT_1278634 [Lactifluus subvellereus]